MQTAAERFRSPAVCGRGGGGWNTEASHFSYVWGACGAAVGSEGSSLPWPDGELRLPGAVGNAVGAVPIWLAILRAEKAGSEGWGQL